MPTEVRCTKLWAALDPQICPDNSDLVAHVSGGDIWVSHTLSGQSERITFAHDGRRSFADDPLSAGTPAYVMQEEFSRYQGYWWQPHSQGTYDRSICTTCHSAITHPFVPLCARFPTPGQTESTV